MKKSVLSLLAIVILILVSKSCEKNETLTEEKITSADIGAIKAVVMSGEWTITYFFDSEKEETSEYDGYVFKFNANGTLGATNGSSSLSGAWSVKSSDHSEDTDSSEVDFDILFSSPVIFEQLSEDWELKMYNETKIELINTSGENGGTHLLTFDKL